MELQIPYCVCTEVPEKGILRRKENRGRKDPKEIVRMETGKDRGSRGVSGSCSHVGRDTAKGSGVEFCRIPEREKHADDIRDIPGVKIQIPK